MNKTGVAQALECSTRQVEKYASEGRLGEVGYVRGKRGRQADYQPQEVERLKAALEQERAEVIGHAPQTALTTPRPAQAIAIVEQLIAGLDRQHADAERIIAALESLKATNGHTPPAVPLADKLTLSLAEAALLSGLARGHLREAITAKKLKARIIGRGFRVKRSD